MLVGGKVLFRQSFYCKKNAMKRKKNYLSIVVQDASVTTHVVGF